MSLNNCRLPNSFVCTSLLTRMLSNHVMILRYFPTLLHFDIVSPGRYWEMVTSLILVRFEHRFYDRNPNDLTIRLRALIHFSFLLSFPFFFLCCLLFFNKTYLLSPYFTLSLSLFVSLLLSLLFWPFPICLSFSFFMILLYMHYTLFLTHRF